MPTFIGESPLCSGQTLAIFVHPAELATNNIYMQFSKPPALSVLVD